MLNLIPACTQLIVLLAPMQASARTTPSQAVHEKLHAAIAQVHDKQRNVGVSVTIRQGDESVFTAFLGEADLEHGVPVKEDTRFGIASISKLYTAVTLLQMLDEIDLDASIHTLVPEFPTKEKGDITLRMLATHSAGIPHPADRTPTLFSTHYGSALEALEVFADKPLLFVPNSRQAYSSSNYNLIAAAIEKVRGTLFTEVVRTSLLEPFGLDHTWFDDPMRPAKNRARRYSFYHPWTYEESDELFVVPTWDYSFNIGGGNLAATSDDVARFGQALISTGLLEPKAVELLHDWFGSVDAEGRPLIYASGANPGLQAGLAVYVEEILSVCVLSNTWGIGSRSGEMTALAKRLGEIYLSPE